MIPTAIPIMNIALGGSLKGGIAPGLLQIAGPSKHFKTLFGLIMIKAFLDKDKDSVVVFYDSEFGGSRDYFANMGIDTSRVIHKPLQNVEELKFDLIKLLDTIEKDEKVMIFIDSIGNLASKKEIEDAMSDKSVADMTRAKALKSLGRMITPVLTMKKIPVVVINHTYDSMSFIPQKVVGGGTGLYYSAQAVWIIGRKQDATAGKVDGYDFTITIDKARAVKEKSKFVVSVGWKDGIDKWSGMLELGLEAKLIVAPTKGYYALKSAPETKYRKKDIPQSFWKELLTDKAFSDYVERTYKIEGDLFAGDDHEED